MEDCAYSVAIQSLQSGFTRQRELLDRLIPEAPELQQRVSEILNLLAENRAQCLPLERRLLELKTETSRLPRLQEQLAQYAQLELAVLQAERERRLQEATYCNNVLSAIKHQISGVEQRREWLAQSGWAPPVDTPNSECFGLLTTLYQFFRLELSTLYQKEAAMWAALG